MISTLELEPSKVGILHVQYHIRRVERTQLTDGTGALDLGSFKDREFSMLVRLDSASRRESKNGYCEWISLGMLRNLCDENKSTFQYFQGWK